MQMATSIEADNGEMIVKRVSVPIGLEELMEGLTKEVIQKKPKDICVFASEYFSNLLNLREEGSLKGPYRKRIQSVTKQISPNNLAKQLKIKSKSVDPKILSRQTSIQPDSPTKRTLTTKKIVLSSKEEKEKALEKTKNFLDKRKARKGSKDESNKIQRQISLGQNDRKERRISRTSSTSTEGSIRSPRKSSQSETKKNKSSGRSDKSDKLSPRKSVDVVSSLGKIGTVATKDLIETVEKSKVSIKDDKTQDSESLSDNKESSTEKEIDDANISDISVSEDSKNQKSEDIVGCTMKCDGAVDTIAESLQKSKRVTPSDVEEIISEKLDNEDAKIQTESKEDEKEVDNSVDEVDLHKNEVIDEEKKEPDINIDEKLSGDESDVKTDTEDVKKSSTNVEGEVSLEDDSQAVEKATEIASSDTLEKEQVENESTEIKESKGNSTTPVKNLTEIDKSIDNAEEKVTEPGISDDLLKVESPQAAPETFEDNQVNDSNLTKNDQRSESVANVGSDMVQDENDADVKKHKDTDDPNGGNLEKGQNNTEVNIIADDTKPEVLKNDQENKENIDANKEEKRDENADDKLSKTVMSSVTSILGNAEIKDSGKSNLKNNRTKSSTTDEYLKANENKTDSKKVKRVKSVDSSIKNLKKTKSKSRLTSANEENQEEDANNVIKKRSKRSVSLDVGKDLTTQQSSFNSSNLHDEIKEVNDLSKITAFKTSYNPYKLRQEIKQASGDGTLNETSRMSQVAGEVAAAIRIQSLWRGFKSRKQTKDNHHLKAIVITDILTDHKKVEEIENTETSSLKESEKLEGKSDNQNSTSDRQINSNHKITAANEEETKDNDGVVNEKDKIIDTTAKPTVDEEMTGETKSSEDKFNDQSKDEQNDGVIKENSSVEDKATKELLVEKNINEESKSIDNQEQDKILQEDSLKLTTPTEEVLSELNNSTESSVEQEEHLTKQGETEIKEDEKDNNNKEKDVDEDIKQSTKEKTKEEDEILSRKNDEKTDDESNNKISSDVSEEVVPKVDLEESKQDQAVVGSVENDKKEEMNDTTMKNTSEDNVEEEIAKKLTSGLNLESSTPLQISDSHNDVKQTQGQTSPQVSDVDASSSSKPKDPLDMALAVVRIQALWRGFKIRSRLKQEKVFGVTVEKEIKNKESLEIMTRIRAVAKIQALWRGYKVRKNIKEVNKRLAELQKPEECDEMPSQRELSDEDIFKAAAKIQAGVRGYMVRKKGNVCHLNSISEETTPDLRATDDQVIQSIEQLEDVPNNSPELKSSEIGSKQKEFTDVDNKGKEKAGNEEVKNNAELNTEEDNKKTENEVKFIASELNSSTTNKLSNLDTSAIIDGSISNSNVNKDGVDPDSSVIHNEPGYEDAPTRPVTSDTELTSNENVDAEAEKNKTENVQIITGDENKEKSNKIIELNKTDRVQEDKQKLFLSQESTTSVDSVATVIFNDTETPQEGDGKQATDKQDIKPDEIKDQAEEKLNISKIDEKSEQIEKIGTLKEHAQVDEEKLENQNISTNDLHKDSMENLTEINNNSDNVSAPVSMNVQHSQNIAEEEEDQPKENKEINNQKMSDMKIEEKGADTKEDDKNVENEVKENGISEASNSENDTLDSKGDTNEKTSSDEAMDPSLTTQDNNKLNVSALEHEINNSSKSVEISNEKSLSDDSSSKEATSSENTLNDAIVSQLSLEHINNKLNVSALENEIGNSNKKLKDLIARSSEELSENLDEPGKESSLDVSAAEDLKTENSLTSTSENLNEVNHENNTKEEEKEVVPSGKDILRIHIPLRELSEIREEDGDGDLKSSTESVEDLEDESKTSSVNHETISKTEDSVNDKLKENVIEPTEAEIKGLPVDNKVEVIDNTNAVEKMALNEHSSQVHDGDGAKIKNEASKLDPEEAVKTQPTSQAEPRQKSPVATINLVHSGEFHDTITVPISLTPPTSASPKEGDNQVHVRQSSPPGLVNTGELHDNVLPLSVQLNEAPPAGAAIVTSHVSESIIADGQDRAQASNKDASTCETQPDNTTSSAASMETEKRNNATTIPKKNMEAEAATKIQAGFRGYQVRKQLKSKISAPGDISNQRRSARRKSSGRISESGRITQNKSKSPADVEEKEKSAVKIQAGVRGFLVRRRQKKQKQGKESS